jgi:hypothetical protein
LIPGPEGDAPVRPPEVDRAVTEPAGKPQVSALSRWPTQRTIVLAVAQFAFLGLLCVSVDHMVLTLAKITNASQWQAWTTAIVIDIVYVVLEWMGLIADEGERQRLRWWTTPTIIATMAFSAGSNAFCIYRRSAGWMVVGRRRDFARVLHPDPVVCSGEMYWDYVEWKPCSPQRPRNRPAGAALNEWDHAPLCATAQPAIGGDEDRD